MGIRQENRFQLGLNYISQFRLFRGYPREVVLASKQARQVWASPPKRKRPEDGGDKKSELHEADKEAKAKKAKKSGADTIDAAANGHVEGVEQQVPERMLLLEKAYKIARGMRKKVQEIVAGEMERVHTSCEMEHCSISAPLDQEAAFKLANDMADEVTQDAEDAMAQIINNPFRL